MPKTPVEVLAEIERAFPKNPIDMDRAFSDWGKGYMDVRLYKGFAHGRTWDALDVRTLETRDDALGFLSAQALADILPAALAALVGPGSPHRAFPYALAVILKRPTPDRDDGLGTQRFEALWERLNLDQRRAVGAALRCFVEAHPESGPAETLGDALDSCWGSVS